MNIFFYSEKFNSASVKTERFNTLGKKIKIQWFFGKRYKKAGIPGPAGSEIFGRDCVNRMQGVSMAFT